MQVEQASLDRFYLKEANCLAFVNGHLSLEDSRLTQLPDELVISDLKTARRNYPQLLDRLNIKAETDLGLFCYIPANTMVPDIIQLLFVGSKKTSLHHLIYLEKGAALSLLEEYRHSNEAHQVKHTVYLEANAELNYYKLQQDNVEVQHQDEFLVQQARDSRFKSTVLSLGAKHSTDLLRVQLCGLNASCDLRAFYHARVKQVIAHEVTVEHLSERCNSQQIYKTIADERGRVVFKGRVKVHPGAQKTNAQQLNQNLLLSSQAEVDAKPELEIYADDVKCSHGSTVGQLNEEALFYLRSRGLSFSEAQHLLTCAFATNVLDDIPDSDVSEFFKRMVIENLTNECCAGDCQNG